MGERGEKCRGDLARVILSIHTRQVREERGVWFRGAEEERRDHLLERVVRMRQV